MPLRTWCRFRTGRPIRDGPPRARSRTKPDQSVHDAAPRTQQRPTDIADTLWGAYSVVINLRDSFVLRGLDRDIFVCDRFRQWRDAGVLDGLLEA